jgi:recombinational DNA repair protein (RecF pathway)
MTKTYTIEGIVLNRRDYSEADRIITIFSQEKGKIVLLAKGVRKLSSKRLGSLEIGTHLRAMAISGKAMDILSQTVIINSYEYLKHNLASITRLYQLLEVIDSLTREGQEHPEVYQILSGNHGRPKSKGFTQEAAASVSLSPNYPRIGLCHTRDVTEIHLKARIEAIADKKLHAKDFLMPDKIKS